MLRDAREIEHLGALETVTCERHVNTWLRLLVLTREAESSTESTAEKLPKELYTATTWHSTRTLMFLGSVELLLRAHGIIEKSKPRLSRAR